MKTLCKRLRRGADLLKEITAFAKEQNIPAGVILSGVGCVFEARIRDASGVTVKTLREPLEIVSLTGTVSAARCHLHISFSKEDLSTVGGHLMEGCIVNTTCELVIGVLDNTVIAAEFDEQTGYNELVFLPAAPVKL